MDRPTNAAGTGARNRGTRRWPATLSDLQRVVAARAGAAVAFPLWRPWRFAAGIALGCAFSVKWSGAMAIFAALILSFAWETTRRRRQDVSLGRAFARAVRQESLGLFIAFVLLPVAVYFIVYLPWFNHFGWSLKDWWENQTAMLAYHKSLRTTALDTATNTYTPTHPYYSRAWTWLFMLRPVNFYSRDVGADIAQVLAVGNPAIFWASIWAIPFVTVMWRRRGDWRAGFIVLPFLAQFLPWFAVTRPQFFFYVAPLTPFMVLAIAYAMRDLAAATIVLREPGRRHGRIRASSVPAVRLGIRAAGGRAVPLVLAGPDRQPDLADRLAGARVVPRLGLT